MNSVVEPETIVAIATPPGRGGVGIVRISGPAAKSIAEKITAKNLDVRKAIFAKFLDAKKIVDEGVAIYFQAPHSFTGDDVVELQGHGSPIVMDSLVELVIRLGARQARPGEFSERAFLNNKIDLTQAEAIADLIDANSQQAARSAMNSLQGEFSQRVNAMVEAVTQLRIYVEAAIDFPEEEIDFLKDSHVQGALENLTQQIQTTINSAHQGALLTDGINVVIAGKPNAGKSSLLNCLSGRESAIVTNIAGTTRDVLRESIQIDGMPLHIIDTAGLRESDDVVEQEGVKRAKQEIENADVILLVVDATHNDKSNECRVLPNSVRHTENARHCDEGVDRGGNLLIVKNKIDKTNTQPKIDNNEIYLSAKTGEGSDLLTKKLKDIVGFNNNTEGNFSARRRHLDALANAQHHLQTGAEQLQQHQAGELLAEDLRQTQLALSEITGEFTSDDLLGRIFSSFCIGK